MGTIERAMKRAQGATERPPDPAAMDESEVVTPAPPDSSVSPPLHGSAPDVHLDFELLRAQGLLTPEEDQRALHEQYRMVKRLLIAHAFPNKTVGVNPPNLIQVTSSVAGEGKTFTSLNLAMSIAMELDHTALVVDADLAHRGLTQLVGASGRQGLTHVLDGSNTQLEQVIYQTNVDSLAVLPAGDAHAQATELMASQAMSRICKELALRYPDRLILFDSTPLGLDSQAATLAQHMGQVLVVVEAGRTSERVIRESTTLLDQSAARIGLMLNKSPRGYGYSYYGGY